MSNDMSFIVYKTTNLSNNKIYIGIHKNKSIDPYHFDGYLGSGIFLLHAIKKYGKRNFIRETIFVGKDWDDVVEVENLLVDSEFKNRKDTYNITEGGKSSPGQWETNKGTVRVIDLFDGVCKRITVEEYESNKDKYQHSNKGKVAVRTIDSDTYFMVDKDDPRIGVEFFTAWKGRKQSQKSIEKGLRSRKENGTWYKTGEEHHLYGKGIPQEAIDRMAETLKKRYESGEIKVWNKDISFKDIYTEEERKRYGRNTKGDLNPSFGSKWLGNNDLGVKCYLKKDQTELEYKLKQNGWVEKPQNFNSLKSVTKNIGDYL